MSVNFPSFQTSVTTSSQSTQKEKGAKGQANANQAGNAANQQANSTQPVQNTGSIDPYTGQKLNIMS